MNKRMTIKDQNTVGVHPIQVKDGVSFALVLSGTLAESCHLQFSSKEAEVLEAPQGGAALYDLL